MKYTVYLVDTNVFLYAFRCSKDFYLDCLGTINYDTPTLKIGITEEILKELRKKGKGKKKIPNTIKIYKIRNIVDEVRELKTNYSKQASMADLSLIQAAINYPEIRGIITYDKDFSHIAASGFIELRTGKKFWLGDARQFSKKHIIRALRKPTPPRAPPVLPRHIKLLFEARARAAVNEAEKKKRMMERAKERVVAEIEVKPVVKRKRKRREKITKCPKCGSSHIIRDFLRAELVCEDCGLVIDNEYYD